MNWSDFYNSYLRFSRRERLAAIIIAVTILIVAFLPELFTPTGKNLAPSAADSAWIAEARTILKASSSSPVIADTQIITPGHSWSAPESATTPTVDLHPFDPISLSVEDWQKLGVSARLSRTIVRYIQKGGRIRSGADLSKIYGMPKQTADRLSPFIRSSGLEDQPGPVSQLSRGAFTTRRAPRTIEINAADTADWEQLPGIGKTLAGRIIRFRNKLGGFHSVDQIGETFGLADSIYRKLRSYLTISAPKINQININVASVDVLAQHPYIRLNLARRIAEYRREHGPYRSVDELMGIMAIKESDYRKMSPYMTIE